MALLSSFFRHADSFQIKLFLKDINTERLGYPEYDCCNQEGILIFLIRLRSFYCQLMLLAVFLGVYRTSW